MASNRIIARFKDDVPETIETLMANTFGHTIPLSIQTAEESLVLTVDDSIPDHLVEHAKQICYEGNKRYYKK